MQNPDQTYTAVSQFQADRRLYAEARRRLRASRATPANEAPGRPRPAWLGDLDRCVEEPAEFAVVVDLQRSAIRQAGELAAATGGD